MKARMPECGKDGGIVFGPMTTRVGWPRLIGRAGRARASDRLIPGNVS